MAYKDKQVAKDYARKWREANREYAHNYYANQAEKFKLAAKAYRDSHREDLREYRRNNKQNRNPDVTKKIIEKRQLRNRAFIDKVKSHYQCMNPECPLKGHKLATYCLDFHHIGEKKFNLGSSGSRSLNLIVKEINKCTILCAVCHRMETWGELNTTNFPLCISQIIQSLMTI